MLDSRLTNAYSFLRADLHSISRIAASVEELLGELHPSWQRNSVNTAANALGSALAALTTALDSIRDAAGPCPHGLGFTPCAAINGHGGHHHNGDRRWDDEQAEQANRAVIAAMGAKTE